MKRIYDSDAFDDLQTTIIDFYYDLCRALYNCALTGDAKSEYGKFELVVDMDEDPEDDWSVPQCVKVRYDNGKTKSLEEFDVSGVVDIAEYLL